MKIAICDDSMKDMAAIEHLLGKYKERYPPGRIYHREVHKFRSPV